MAEPVIPWSQRVPDLVVLLLLAPFALVVALACAVAVLLDSPGPVLYRSRRVGLGGREFSMLKFRTMRHDMPGPPLSAAGDARYTPVGRWLARWHLDEIPQLGNVLRGEMRLVGPRPEDPHFVAAFHADYEEILSIAPGLTGPTQLASTEERRLLAAAADRVVLYRSELLPQKVLSDIAYVRTRTALGDLVILLRTLPLPFRAAVALVRELPAIRASPRAQASVLASACLSVSAVVFVALFVLEGA